jgi:hypothetical protein
MIIFRIQQFVGWTMAIGGSMASVILTLYVVLLLLLPPWQWLRREGWPQAPTLREWIVKWLDLPISRAEWVLSTRSLQFLFDLHAGIGIFGIAFLCLVIARFGVYMADNATYRLVQKRRIRIFFAPTRSRAAQERKS